MSNNLKGIIYAGITAICFGFLAIMLKVAVQKVEPETIVWFRFVISFAILASWQTYRNPQSLKILVKPPLLLVIAALGLSWNYMGFMLGVHYTSPSNAQLIIQSGTISLALAGFIFFKEKIRKWQIGGFILAGIGFVLFYQEQIKLMIGIEDRYNLGVMFTFTSAMAWAIYAILQKSMLTKYSPASLNLFLFGFPSLLYLPFVNFASLANLGWIWWALIISLGLNTFIAYTSLAMALRYTEANKVSIIVLLNPMITFITMGILAWLNVSWVENERFSVFSLIGAAIVLAGAILVVGKPFRKK